VGVCVLQVLQQGWLRLLCSHQHGNIRPHVQLFLLVLFSRHPAAAQELLLPALNTFNTTSYQVHPHWLVLSTFVTLSCHAGLGIQLGLIC
jgi:hypothetical protein